MFSNTEIYEFLPIFFSLCVSLVVSIVMLLLSIIFGPKLNDPEKLSTYECGFNPFEDSRNTFDVKFYLVAIIFIIFDIEVILLLPCVVNYLFLKTIGFLSIIGFLLILTFGFFYEWKKNVFNWS